MLTVPGELLVSGRSSRLQLSALFQDFTGESRTVQRNTRLIQRLGLIYRLRYSTCVAIVREADRFDLATQGAKRDQRVCFSIGTGSLGGGFGRIQRPRSNRYYVSISVTVLCRRAMENTLHQPSSSTLR
jgi:hypothetical protein